MLVRAKHDWTDNEAAGYLPLMLSVWDKRGAVEQLDAAYAHGGGWHDFKGFSLNRHADGSYGLAYPGDPEMRERSRTQLRGETIILFECDWVVVEQQNGSFRAARMD
jgi:hypothetical protein